MKRIFLVLGVLLSIPMVIAGLAALSARRRQEYGDEGSDTFDLVVVTGSREFASRAPSFAGGSVLAVMAGAEIDLRDAELDSMGGYLEVDCWFAGVDIVVPAHWRVITHHRAFAGGVSNEAESHNSALPEGAPMLEIDARAVFGGISVRTVGEPARATPEPVVEA